MSARAYILLSFIVFFLFGCAGVEQESDEIVGADADLENRLGLPATYTGRIPCEDCLGVDIVLNLRPDSLYQLRKTYRYEHEAARVEAQIGQWRYSPEGELIILGKSKGSLKTYKITDPNHLRFVRWEGADSDEQIQYDLERAPKVDPFDDRVKMRGMYRLERDRAVIAECTTGRTFPVARAGEYQTTSQAYLNMPHPYGEPMLLSFLGSLRETGGSEVVAVERFNRFYPNQDCEGNEILTGLTGTYWRLVELEGEPIPEDGMTNSPFLIFEQDKTMTGFGGCNRISGTYLLQGEIFLVKRAATTRIACPAGMERENGLLRALDEAESYRIEDGELALLDQYDQVRARFVTGP